MTDDNRARFEAAMLDAGWHKYGNGTQWKHDKTGRIERDDVAYRFWLQMGLTVMPW